MDRILADLERLAVTNKPVLQPGVAFPMRLARWSERASEVRQKAAS